MSENNDFVYLTDVIINNKKIGSALQKLIGAIHRHHGDSISLIYFSQ
jgi:hypothetical protein